MKIRFSVAHGNHLSQDLVFNDAWTMKAAGTKEGPSLFLRLQVHEGLQALCFEHILNRALSAQWASQVTHTTPAQWIGRA